MGGGGGGTVQNHSTKAPSPVQGLSVSRLGKPEFSSASKVLTEEIQKQRESDNAKLKTLIVKEIRKPGKSKQADMLGCCEVKSNSVSLGLLPMLLGSLPVGVIVNKVSLLLSFLLSCPPSLSLSLPLSPPLSLFLSADYDAIFQHLEAVRGSVDIRRGFVREVVKEAGKFKRKQLIQQLEEWGAKLTPLKPVGGTHGAHTHNKTKTVPQRR